MRFGARLILTPKSTNKHHLVELHVRFDGLRSSGLHSWTLVRVPTHCWLPEDTHVASSQRSRCNPSLAIELLHQSLAYHRSP